MADVFISYASEDRSRVEPLARALIDAGFTVWWDRDILGGADFSQEIERELDAARAVVVAWSATACASKWVRDEAAYGRDRGKLVPVVIEVSEPPLGFRQIQSLDFVRWTGDTSAPAFASLLAAIRRETPRASSAPPAPAAVNPQIRRRMIVAGAAAAVLAVVAAFSLMRADRPVTVQNAADPVFANPAVAALGTSERPEERAAYERFVGGDRKEALAMIERLALDLERKGETAAAAEAYTRAASIALLVDQARGLAARGKAFELAPDSLAAFQGLFFDTLLMKGSVEAEKIGEEVLGRKNASAKLRGFAYAHLAIAVGDLHGDFARAEEYTARIRALDPGDRFLEGLALWAASVVDWRRDRLDEAQAQLVKSEAFLSEMTALDLPPPNDVNGVRISFSAGDWDRAFELAVSGLDERRKAGGFIPTPMLFTACLSGLYTGKIEAAAPYCTATASYAAADSKLFSAELAAARGELDEARAELAAARAIGPRGPLYEAQQMLLEAAIVARSGDLDAAQTLLWRHLDLLAGRSDGKSRRATALRLYGLWMIAAKAPERACTPLAEAAVLYTEVGGDAGAEAAENLQRDAGCKDS